MRNQLTDLSYTNITDFSSKEKYGLKPNVKISVYKGLWNFSAVHTSRRTFKVLFTKVSLMMWKVRLTRSQLESFMTQL